MPNLDPVSRYRREEANIAMSYFSPLPIDNNILEIGAGTGFQALCFMESGYNVIPIDVIDSRHRNFSWIPITIYDGINFPFEDSKFRTIFSSNVFEHIKDIDSYMASLFRILSPDGVLICILPEPSWRIATSLCYYPFLAKTLFLSILDFLKHFSGKKNNHSVDKVKASDSDKKSYTVKSFISRLLQLVFPPTHGGNYSSFLEIYYFSRKHWVKTFQTSNFIVEQTVPLHLFYTGYNLLGNILPLRVRKLLSYVLGSSTRMYIIKK